MCFHIVEAADKLLVGMLQCIVRIYFIQACGIDKAEHYVTEFLFCFLLVHAGHFGLEFSDFFFYFIPHLFPFFPVETHVAGFVLNAVCLDERGQGGGHTAQHRFVAPFFLEFQLFPVFGYLSGSLRFHITEYVGMAEDKLFT